MHRKYILQFRQCTNFFKYCKVKRIDTNIQSNDYFSVLQRQKYNNGLFESQTLMMLYTVLQLPRGIIRHHHNLYRGNIHSNSINITSGNGHYLQYENSYRNGILVFAILIHFSTMEISAVLLLI